MSNPNVGLVVYRDENDVVARNYRGSSTHLANGLRLDLLVEDAIVVEVKAVEQLLPVHDAQLLSYLRHSERRLGLLLNFNVPHLRHGIHRRMI